MFCASEITIFKHIYYLRVYFMKVPLLGNPPFYIGFSWTPPLKVRLFSESLKYYILYILSSYLLKVTKFLVNLGQRKSPLHELFFLFTIFNLQLCGFLVMTLLLNKYIANYSNCNKHKQLGAKDFFLSNLFVQFVGCTSSEIS